MITGKFVIIEENGEVFLKLKEIMDTTVTVGEREVFVEDLEPLADCVMYEEGQLELFTNRRT